jgi:hypothetical protein
MAKSRSVKKELISIVGYDDMEERGLFDRRLVRDVIDAEKLADSVKSFLGAMETIIGTLSQELGNYKMETISVSAEVSAKGTVSLLGSGGEVAGKGGLTFTFKRSGGARTNP